VSVDKPPLALWIQVAAAKLLGFSSLAQAGGRLRLGGTLSSAGRGSRRQLYDLKPEAGLVPASEKGRS
jgi:hypothetical protein